MFTRVKIPLVYLSEFFSSQKLKLNATASKIACYGTSLEIRSVCQFIKLFKFYYSGIHWVM
jgi:hypothetical protein